ncbi:MAG: class I SAM-dependent methyltransferase [Candidatus Binataceae bacterium]
MGLHRVIRRYRNKGGSAALRYIWRLQKNNLIRVANLAGPIRKRCPCCGWSGMRFLDYAGHRQNNIICPRCGSHPRQRVLSLFLEAEIARLNPGSAVLHFSAERNMTPIFARREDLRYVTADLNLKSAMVRADATRLPFQPDSFRMIVSSHMLEHIQDDRVAVAEFARVLGPGGEAIIMVPTLVDWRSSRTREFGAPDPRLEGHWRIYGFDLADRLQAAGLECRTIGIADFVSDEIVHQCELMDDAIFVARKPGSSFSE